MLVLAYATKQIMNSKYGKYVQHLKQFDSFASGGHCCWSCGLMFLQKPHYDDHMNHFHAGGANTTVGVLVCDNCGKQFVNGESAAKDLKEHLLDHDVANILWSLRMQDIKERLPGYAFALPQAHRLSVDVFNGEISEEGDAALFASPAYGSPPPAPEESPGANSASPGPATPLPSPKPSSKKYSSRAATPAAVASPKSSATRARKRGGNKNGGGPGSAPGGKGSGKKTKDKVQEPVKKPLKLKIRLGPQRRKRARESDSDEYEFKASDEDDLPLTRRPPAKLARMSGGAESAKKAASKSEKPAKVEKPKKPAKIKPEAKLPKPKPMQRPGQLGANPVSSAAPSAATSASSVAAGPSWSATSVVRSSQPGAFAVPQPPKPVATQPPKHVTPAAQAPAPKLATLPSAPRMPSIPVPPPVATAALQSSSSDSSLMRPPLAPAPPALTACPCCRATCAKSTMLVMHMLDLHGSRIDKIVHTTSGGAEPPVERHFESETCLFCADTFPSKYECLPHILFEHERNLTEVEPKREMTQARFEVLWRKEPDQPENKIAITARFKRKLTKVA